jgi:hypothetical protein
MKNLKSLFRILTTLFLIVLTTSCKKDKVDTTPVNSTVSYKKVTCSSDDSILIAEQCAVVEEPLTDLLNITMKLKYTGEKFASLPRLIIRGKDKSGKILFENISFLSNTSSVCKYYSNTYGSGFVSKSFPSAYAHALIDLSEFSFKFDDVYSIDITKVELHEENDFEIDTSLVFEPLKNEGQKFIAYFKNQSQMQANFALSFETAFFYNEKEDLLGYVYVDISPKLIFQPNERGYLSIANTYYNHKITKVDFTLSYSLDTIKVARILKSNGHYDDYLLSRKIMKEDYELLKSRQK